MWKENRQIKLNHIYALGNHLDWMNNSKQINPAIYNPNGKKKNECECNNAVASVSLWNWIIFGINMGIQRRLFPK